MVAFCKIICYDNYVRKIYRVSGKTERIMIMVKSEKPAAKKTAAKKPAAKTTAAKPAVKAAKTAKKPAAKKTVKKPVFVTADEMCVKLRTLINSEKAAAVKTNVAVDVEVWGCENESKCHLYIEIKDGVLDVQPYDYNECSFEAYISYENMIKLLDGKLTIKDAVANGALNANGNIPAALVVASIF